MSEKHIRALRDDARRARGRLAEYSNGRLDGEKPAADRRAALERSARQPAARLAFARGQTTPGT